MFSTQQVLWMDDGPERRPGLWEVLGVHRFVGGEVRLLKFKTLKTCLSIYRRNKAIKWA